MKRIALLLLSLLLLIPVLAFAEDSSGEESFLLTVGSSGSEVLSLKKRLYELGYYQTSSFSKKYTQDTADTVSAFQRNNALEETGTVDQALWDLIFSDAAQAAPTATPKPFATPAPTPQPDYPDRDAEGYLAGEGEYVYENSSEGLWVYLSQTLQITIVRREDSTVPLIWFETDIRMRGGEELMTCEANPDRPGTRFRYPQDLARENGYVLAFSDDFYGDRFSTGAMPGIVIRNGKILAERSYAGSNHHFPNLDLLIQRKDGSLEAAVCGSYTAQELMDSGAVNVFSFGPVMITKGRISPELTSGYYSSNEPRQCLGMIEPGHYFLLSIQGRMNESIGTTLFRAAGILLEHGVTEAMNLDGGNTVALVFRGKLLNHAATTSNKKSVRTVNSVIGVGHTENLSDK